MKRIKTIIRNRKLISRYVYVITKMKIGELLTLDLIAHEYDLTRLSVKAILKEHEMMVKRELNKNTKIKIKWNM